MSRRSLLVALLIAALAGLSGCARGGEGGISPVPEAVLEIVWQMAGPVNDDFYYYVAFDTDQDEGADFPVPVASGPYWGNGWGTGSITHFLEYHAGQYQLYAADLNVVIRDLSAGFLDVSGTVSGGDAGEYTVTVTAVNLGAVMLTGTGAIDGVTNDSDQNAGTLELQTNANGAVVPGSVVFTPAVDGGRGLDAAEQAQLDALNGGALLAVDSLDRLGLTLTLATGPDLSGSQTIEIGAATADVDVAFESASTGEVSADTATLTANSTQATADPPIPGAIFSTGDLVVGDQAVVGLEVVTATGTSLGPPYMFVPPNGTDTLRATIDLANLGLNLTNISINFITTTDLIFDPTVTNPDQHTYDGLGPLGNDALRIFDPTEFMPINNDGAFVRELEGDSTLLGPASPEEQAAVDIVDWQITPRLLR